MRPSWLLWSFGATIVLATLLAMSQSSRLTRMNSGLPQQMRRFGMSMRHPAFSRTRVAAIKVSGKK